MLNNIKYIYKKNIFLLILYMYLNFCLIVFITILLYIIYTKRNTLREGKRRRKFPKGCNENNKNSKFCAAKICKKRKGIRKELCFARKRCHNKSKRHRYIHKYKNGERQLGKCDNIKEEDIDQYEWVRTGDKNKRKWVKQIRNYNNGDGKPTPSSTDASDRVVKCKTGTIPKNWTSAHTFTPTKWHDVGNDELKFFGNMINVRSILNDDPEDPDPKITPSPPSRSGPPEWYKPKEVDCNSKTFVGIEPQRLKVGTPFKCDPGRHQPMHNKVNERLNNNADNIYKYLGNGNIKRYNSTDLATKDGWTENAGIKVSCGDYLYTGLVEPSTETETEGYLNQGSEDALTKDKTAVLCGNDTAPAYWDDIFGRKTMATDRFLFTGRNKLKWIPSDYKLKDMNNVTMKDAGAGAVGIECNKYVYDGRHIHPKSKNTLFKCNYEEGESKFRVVDGNQVYSKNNGAYIPETNYQQYTEDTYYEYVGDQQIRVLGRGGAAGDAVKDTDNEMCWRYKLIK
jgi:hypothetical protein